MTTLGPRGSQLRAPETTAAGGAPATAAGGGATAAALRCLYSRKTSRQTVARAGAIVAMLLESSPLAVEVATEVADAPSGSSGVWPDSSIGSSHSKGPLPSVFFVFVRAAAPFLRILTGM